MLSTRSLNKKARQRSLGEARRLFYVAVTRARKRLHLSGVVKPNKAGDWQFPSNSPLGWLRQHYPAAALPPGTANLWPNPLLTVSLNPEIPEPTAQPVAPITTLAPYDFHPEPFPYEIRFPSQLVGASGNEASIKILPASLHPPGSASDLEDSHPQRRTRPGIPLAFLGTSPASQIPPLLNRGHQRLMQPRSVIPLSPLGERVRVRG